MNNSNSTPVARVVSVNAVMARDWLTRNINNRKPRDVVVQRYRNDMTEGRWLFAADPIRFDQAGNLIDGQHRLMALAGLDDSFAVDFLVVTKLATVAQAVMDSGTIRLTSDQLTIAGFKDTAAAGAGIKLYLTHETGMLWRDNKAASAVVTKAAIVGWAQTNHALLDSAISVPLLRANDAPPSVSYCAAIMFVQNIGHDNTVEFFRLLHEGAGAGHPINALDKRLQTVRRTRQKVPQRDMLAWFIVAANSWIEGRELTKLQAPRGAKWTKDTFPQLKVVAA